METAWEVYDGHIKERRDTGATLQQIADEVGRTRERVRQILVEHYGTADIQGQLLTTTQLAKLAGCSQNFVATLRREGIISRVAWGRWSLETLDIILERRRCKMCGSPRSKGRLVYCSEPCQIEAAKYKNRPEAQKKTHSECVRRWQREHPERYKEIQRRAIRSYQLRQHQFFHQRFSLLIPVNLDNIPIIQKEETMYPYKATIIQKETVPKGALPPGQYTFLAELKKQLQPGQAIQLVVPANLKDSLTASWRQRIGKGEEPHTQSKKQEDGSYLVYLWLGGQPG